MEGDFERRCSRRRKHQVGRLNQLRVVLWMLVYRYPAGTQQVGYNGRHMPAGDGDCERRFRER